MKNMFINEVVCFRQNLDTGEEYIIGENDPDFEYDNFPLRPGECESYTFLYEQLIIYFL